MREEERGGREGRRARQGETQSEREEGRGRKGGRGRQGERERGREKERDGNLTEKEVYTCRGRPHQHRQATNNSQLSNVHITLSLEREIIYGMD